MTCDLDDSIASATGAMNVAQGRPAIGLIDRHLQHLIAIDRLKEPDLRAVLCGTVLNELRLEVFGEKLERGR